MRLSRIGAIAVVAAGIGVLAAGCRGEREERALGTERPGQPQITPGVPPGAPPQAQPQEQPGQPQAEQGLAGKTPAQQIAQARCEQMQRCGGIGEGKKHATMSTCLSAVTADFGEELNAFECPGGFDSKELNECLSELRGEACDAPFQRLGSILACRSSDICKNVP